MQTKLFIALHSSSITLLCPIAIKSMWTDSAFISEGTALRLCEQIALWAEAPWTSHALRSGVHGPTQKPLQGRTGQAQRVSCARLRAGGQAGRAAPNSSWQAPAPPGDEPPKWLQTPQGWPQFLSWLLVVRFLAAYLKSQWPWGLSFPFKIRIYILSSWTVGSFSFCLKISFLKSKYQMTNVIDVCVKVPPYLKYLG